MAWIPGAASLCLALVVVLPDHADPTAADRETARALMDQGDARVAQKDYAAALQLYRAADAIMHVPTTGLEVARTAVALGKLVEGRDAALAVARIAPVPGEPAVFAQSRNEATALAQALAARIPSILVRVSGLAPGSALRLTVDGEVVPEAAASLPRRVDPGHHVILASATGQREVSREVTVAERAQAVVELSLPPAAATGLVASPTLPAPSGAAYPALAEEAPHGRSPFTYVALGTGVAGLLVGGITGLMSLASASSARNSCTGNVCMPAAQGDINSSKTLANVSDVGFAAGIAGVAVGSILFFATTPRSRATDVPSGPTVSCGPRELSLGWTGRF
jgi:hypothetical protein